MFGYTTNLRSITQGRASSSMELDHYADVPTTSPKLSSPKTPSKRLLFENLRPRRAPRQPEPLSFVEPIEWENPAALEVHSYLGEQAINAAVPHGAKVW